MNGGWLIGALCAEFITKKCREPYIIPLRAVKLAKGCAFHASLWVSESFFLAKSKDGI